MPDGSPAPISIIFAKQTSLRQSPRLVPLVVIFASSFGIYAFFSRIPHVMKPPLAIAISTCPAVTSGVYRIASDFGVRFDPPERAFTVRTVVRDAPPGTLYVIKLNDADANMAVWRDDDTFRDFKITYRIFSEHVEERNIGDATGRISGTDNREYLQSGERWRYVRFSRGGAAGYKPTPPKQADLLDQVANSACFSRDEP